MLAFLACQGILPYEAEHWFLFLVVKNKCMTTCSNCPFIAPHVNWLKCLPHDAQQVGLQLCFKLFVSLKEQHLKCFWVWAEIKSRTVMAKLLETECSNCNTKPTYLS